MRRRSVQGRGAEVVEAIRHARLRPGRARSFRLLIGARILWGTALLIAPEAVLGALPHQRIDRRARAFAGLLGARHLLEATVTGRRHTRGWILAGATVDATHAASMVILAGLRPDRRVLALTNAATATTLAAGGLAEARRI